MRKLMSTLFASAMLIASAGCDVDVEDPGSLPDVKVEEGEMPEVDATAPEIDAEMEETTIETPDIDVDIPEENEQ